MILKTPTENNLSNSSENSVNEIKYIELNEENYEKYNSKVVKISDNKDGSYTIIARIFEGVVLPALTKNNDGTARLSYYSEMSLGRPTQTYMRTIVDKQVFADDEISEYSSEEINSSKYEVLVYSEDIQFENGRVSFFAWTGN